MAANDRRFRLTDRKTLPQSPDAGGSGASAECWTRLDEWRCVGSRLGLASTHSRVGFRRRAGHSEDKGSTRPITVWGNGSPPPATTPPRSTLDGVHSHVPQPANTRFRPTSTGAAPGAPNSLSWPSWLSCNARVHRPRGRLIPREPSLEAIPALYADTRMNPGVAQAFSEIAFAPQHKCTSLAAGGLAPQEPCVKLEIGQ